MNKKNILVTGGAGFIGANLVKAFIQDPRIGSIRVLDNLATGHLDNISSFISSGNIEFIKGDIRKIETCRQVMKEIHLVTHQAALGSVPRSIHDPLTTNEVNTTGTLNIFQAAVENKVERVVFAASSSTYGDHTDLPKMEDVIGKPLSPYALTKYVNELYAEVYARTYDFQFIGLRYFNVFGPLQDPNGAYAAVIPLFMQAAIENRNPIINGDGSFSRDFTYIDNIVQLNLLALFTENESALDEVYNGAYGNQTSLNQLWSTIKTISSSAAQVEHGPQRAGDVPHSLASIEKARKLLGYQPKITVKEGLLRTFQYYKSKTGNEV